MIEKSLKLNVLSIVAILLFVGGCTAPQTRDVLSQSMTPKNFIMNDVPFYQQQDFYCGPTTIAEVLNYYGENLDPVDIAPSMFIPGKEGSLQIEMVASVRQLGYVAYQKEFTMNELLATVAEGVPVIVLQNNGLSWYPMWHYAVVIGYDLPSESVILHTGLTPKRLVEMSVFERTWKRADQWALIPIPADKSLDGLELLPYLQAAQDLVSVGRRAPGLTALTTAHQRWPNAYLPPFLLGNAHLSENPDLAVQWFKKAYERNREDPNLLNNYAYALNMLGCKNKASQLIRAAIAIKPENKAFLNTQDKIAKSATESSTQQCQY